MKEKLIRNCEENSCKDKLEQLQNLLKSNEDGDYKVIIMADIMDELLAKKKAREALEIAAQAKSMYPKSPYLENIKTREEQTINPLLTIKYESQTQSNLPIHLVAQHKNVTEFSLNIYEVKEDFTSLMQYVQNPYSNTFAKVKKIW